MVARLFQNGKLYRHSLIRMSPTLISLALVAAVLAPAFLAARHPIAAMFLRSFFAHLCHQRAGRSFAIDGASVAVCVRCLGVYCGVALAAVPPLVRLTGRRWLVGALLLNALDVFAQTMHVYGNLPLLRFLLGMWMGIAAGALLGSSRAVASVKHAVPSE
jgi:uncharacterized membrane protein